MKFDKLYKKYKSLICKNFYLIAIIYLFLHLITLYFNIELSHFIFIFKLEKFNYIELIIYICINLLCIYITQKIINKILIKNPIFIYLCLIFIIPLYISFIIMGYDIILLILYHIYDNKDSIISLII